MKLPKRKLEWLLLASLGVGNVVAGDYAAWNYGLTQGGWSGMIIAVAIASVLYLCLCLCLAELATLFPASAGGGYAFTRLAFGHGVALLTGWAVTLEYVAGAAAVACFFSSYFKSVFGLDERITILALFGVGTLLQLRGIRETLRASQLLVAIAAVGLLAAVVSLLPHFSVAHLFDVPAEPAAGGSPVFPRGLLGVWAAIPFAIAMFSGVEGVALAAEETVDSHRHIPKGLIAAVLTLALFALAILVALPGAVGSSTLGGSSDPLADALVLIETNPHALLLSYAIRLCALTGLAASFLGLTYAGSRQVFGLARVGGLPQALATVNLRGVPAHAAIWPTMVAMVLALSVSPERLVVSCVMGASISYVSMTAAHAALKKFRPTLPRLFSAPGHLLLPLVALVLSLITGIACLLAAPRMVLASAGVLLLLTFCSLLGGRERDESTVLSES